MTIPHCLGPAVSTRPPSWTPPKGAWDTHFHVLGPQSRFPYAPDRKYSPPDAPLEVCMRMHDVLGIERGFVVHANTHGFDNTVDLDAVANSGGRYLAVVRLDATATRDKCKVMHLAGARGVRFAFNPQHGGSLDLAVFNHVMQCIEGLGWFVELHFDGAALPDLQSWIVKIPAPVVIDHFGRIDAGLGINHQAFRALSELAAYQHVWIKLTGADRISQLGPPYADIQPFAQRLVEIAADRLLWGSDWPHTGYFDADRMPQAGQLLDALCAFVPQPHLRDRILVDNPLRLIGNA